jgi:bile acid:Na+ symporter, BASS family
MYRPLRRIDCSRCYGMQVDIAASGFKALILLTLQVSVFCTVFGFGLDTTVQDMLYVIRRPGLLARCLFAMFVIMPAVAIALAATFEFRHVVEVALVALSISPIPPLLPRREGRAVAGGPYALGLMAVLALLSIVLVPFALEVLKRIVRQPLEMSSSAVARVVLETALAPLAAGAIVRALLPRVAPRLRRVVNRVAWVLFTAGIMALLAPSLPAMWALVGNGTLVAMTAFISIALAVGHVVGGPDPEHSAVLALSNACRHPAIAVSIASRNYPDEQFGATVLLYVVMNLTLCIPYVMWQRRRTRARPDDVSALGRPIS